jgi:iron(III) transport system ATP-binding protein
MNAVECRSLRKTYGNQLAVNEVSFSLPEGQFMALLGPSGCGKTTILRLIAGLDRPDLGEICLFEKPVFGDGVFVPPNLRGVGMVFQDYALFPHLTVEENIAYGLPRRSPGRVSEMLALVGLLGYEKRYPQQLSGGQQQRVALARALAPQPHTLLLDEPFSNLDAGLRVLVREEVRRIIRETGVSTILVTHDQDEAMSLADQIGVMLGGRIVQLGSPRDVYENPSSLAVALFLGEANRLMGEARGEFVLTALGELPLKKSLTGQVEVLVRPEQVHIVADGYPARVERVAYYGNRQTVWLVLESGLTLMASVDFQMSLQPESLVQVAVRGVVLAFPA